MATQQTLKELAVRFNQQSKSDLLLLKKCSELKEEKHYIIHNLRKMDTTIGDAILAALSEAPYKEGDTPKFQVFLPRRFVVLLQNEDLESILPGTLYIVSHGKCGNNSTELTMHLVNSL